MGVARFPGWRHAAACLFVATLPALAAAQAWPSQTAKDSHLRAGPATEYPVVAVLLRGTEVTVEGCLTDFRWCDVSVAGYRGWVYAGNLVLSWQGQPAPVLDAGAVIGIAILGFALEDYWGQHYRAAPWYPHRHDWVRRVPPAVAPSRPSMPPTGGPRLAPPPGSRPAELPAARPVRPVMPQPPVSAPRSPIGTGTGTQVPPRPRAPDAPRTHEGSRTHEGPSVAPAARGPDAAPRPAPSHPQADRRQVRPAGQGKRTDQD